MRAWSRVLAAVIALALVVVGIVGIVEVILAAAGRDPWLVPHDEWLADLRETPWRDDAVVLAGIVLLATGLLLLATQLVARRPRTWTVASPESSDTAMRSDVTSRSINAAARDAAAGVDGITAARARLGRKGLRVDARTARTTGGELDQPVRDAVIRVLGPLALEPAPPVHVRVRQTR